MAGGGGKPDAGSSAGPGADSYVAMVARAKALIPELRDRASKTEELRRLPPETERDLHDAGLFRIVQPKRVGGAELDYVALVDCADALGQADASVAWNFANLASHHWMLGMFDRQAQDIVWGRNADALIASGVELWNMYGPTETTVWSTCARILDTGNGITIGKPIANTTIRILDEQKREGAELPEKIYLRMRVVGGGCSGFQHKLDLDPAVNPALDEVWLA